MEKSYENFQLSQKVALYDPGTQKFLLLKEVDGMNGLEKYEGPWDLPGGRVYDQEDREVSLQRELREEIGEIDLEIGSVVLANILQVRNEKALRRCRLYYVALYRGGELKISSEHTEFRWESLDEISRNDEYQPIREVIEKAAVQLKQEGYLADLQRLQADFENYKKRQQESQKELGGYLTEKLVLDIVPVLDNFRSATMHVPPEQKDSPWVVGIQYIEKQLETVLVDNGVTPIDAELGEAFDPNLHEAVGTEEGSGEPVEEEGQGHKIAKVLQKGYKVGTKVVRPARVSVS